MNHGIFVIFLTFLLDQISKFWVMKNVTIPIRVLPILNIVQVHNSGITFGFLQDLKTWQYTLLLTVIFTVTIYAIRLHSKAKRGLEKLALSLILGGALSNIWDRFYHGYVIDFIDFHIGSLHYWAFNIADAAIVLGILLVFYYQIFAKKG